MASTSETGHARNAANFNKLITLCEKLGTKYNPSSPALQLSALRDLLAKSQTCLDDIKTQEAAYKKAVGDRQSCYAPLKSLSTRVLGALLSTDASDKVKEDSKKVGRKIQGTRLGNTKSKPSGAEAAAEGEPVGKSISTSQQSYDLQADHFKELIALLETASAYQPNEPELQIAALKTCYTDMLTANTSAAGAEATLSNARILRNSVMYDDKNNLRDVATAVKSYVRSVYGAASPTYKQINSVPFKKR